MRKLPFVVMGLILIAIPLFVNWLVSFNVPFTTIIISKNQEIWTSSLISWFSGTIGAFIGGYIAYIISKSQNEANFINERKHQVALERRQLALNSYNDLKDCSNTLIQMTVEIYNYFNTLIIEQNESYYKFDENKIVELRKQFYEIITITNGFVNRNSIILSEFQNESKCNYKINSILALRTEIILLWDNLCVKITDSLKKSNGLDSIYNEINNILLPKMDKIRFELNEYEKEYIKFYLNEIFRVYESKLKVFEKIEFMD